MARPPMRTEAGQGVDDMAAQLAESREGNRLYSTRKGNYKEISDQLKTEALDAAIDQQLDLLKEAKRRGRVDLNDLDEVEATATAYMQSCKKAGVFPTMLGFAAACGCSRKHIYSYINSKNTKTAQYLDSLRSSWNAIIAQMGLARQCSESVSIFLLKNSGQDMTDRAEIDMTARQIDPFERADKEIDAESIARKYGFLVELDEIPDLPED